MAQLLNAFGIFDGGPHLEAVANDASVGQQPRHIRLAIGRHRVNIEAVEGGVEGGFFLENGQPRQTGLVDFEHEALE